MPKIQTALLAALFLISLNACSGAMHARKGLDQLPAALRGDFTWLNNVKDEFQKVASTGKSRTLASSGPSHVFFQTVGMSVGYKNGNFYLIFNNKNHALRLINKESMDYYSFLGDEKSDHPLMLSILPGKNQSSFDEGRTLASTPSSCSIELQLWGTKKYSKRDFALSAQNCQKILNQLVDHAP